MKKNLEQSTDGEGSGSIPVRVTRSSVNPVQSSTTSSYSIPHSPKKFSKRLMMKKKLLLQAKAKSLRLQGMLYKDVTKLMIEYCSCLCCIMDRCREPRTRLKDKLRECMGDRGLLWEEGMEVTG